MVIFCQLKCRRDSVRGGISVYTSGVLISPSGHTVITSYSIHYTKLYEPFTLDSRRNTSGSAGDVITDAWLGDVNIPNFDWSKGGSVFFFV